MGKILIVVDMQKDFVDGVLGSLEAVKIVPDVVKAVKDFDGEILFTKDTHQENYLDTQEGKNLPVKHCIKGSDGWELVPELAKLQESRNLSVFEKGAFGSVDLGKILAKENEKDPIDSITLCGVCTDICVISNAMILKGFLPEVPIKILSSCCAGVTADSHNTALQAMKACQIEIL